MSEEMAELQHFLDVEYSLKQDPAIIKVLTLLHSSDVIAYKLIGTFVQNIPCRDLSLAYKLVASELGRRQRRNILVPETELPNDFDFCVKPGPPGTVTTFENDMHYLLNRNPRKRSSGNYSKSTFSRSRRLSSGSRNSSPPKSRSRKSRTRKSESESPSRESRRARSQTRKSKKPSPFPVSSDTIRTGNSCSTSKPLSRKCEKRSSNDSPATEAKKRSRNRSRSIPRAENLKSLEANSPSNLVEDISSTSMNHARIPSSGRMQNENEISKEPKPRNCEYSRSKSSSTKSATGNFTRDSISSERQRNPRSSSRNTQRRQDLRCDRLRRQRSGSSSSSTADHAKYSKYSSSSRQQSRSRSREVSRMYQQIPENRSPTPPPTPPVIEIPSISSLICKLEAAGKYSPALRLAYEQMQAEERSLIVDLKVWYVKRLKLRQSEVKKDSAYKESWSEFWKSRYSEIRAEGKLDPEKYDYFKDWKTFWAKKVESLLQEKLSKSLKHLRLKYQFDEESVLKLLNIEEDQVDDKPELPFQSLITGSGSTTSPSNVEHEPKTLTLSPRSPVKTAISSNSRLDANTKMNLTSTALPETEPSELSSVGAHGCVTTKSSLGRESPEPEEIRNLAQDVLWCLASFDDLISTTLQTQAHEFDKKIAENPDSPKILIEASFQDFLVESRKRLEIMIKLSVVPSETMAQMLDCSEQISRLLRFYSDTDGVGRRLLDYASSSDSEDPKSSSPVPSQNLDENSVSQTNQAICPNSVPNLMLQIQQAITGILATHPNRELKITEVTRLIKESFSNQELGFIDERELTTIVAKILRPAPVLPQIPVPEPQKLYFPTTTYIDPFAQFRRPRMRPDTDTE